QRRGRGAGRRAAVRILVVEDDADIGAMIGEVLRDEGYLIAAVTSAEQAQATLANARYDLVLTDALADLALPEGHWATIERIRDPAGGVPVVICTAHHPSRFADFAARGFGGLIVKPFDLDDLLELIARLLVGPPDDAQCGAGGVSRGSAAEARAGT